MQESEKCVLWDRRKGEEEEKEEEGKKEEEAEKEGEEEIKQLLILYRGS